MYNGIKKISQVIDYIEQNITTEIDCAVLAKMMGLSVYEFRRIFAFIVGCPISEYIRKRRLSLAACEIMLNKDINILNLSEKYGYSTQSAFTKAFGEQHGVTPLGLVKNKSGLKLFTCPKFELNVSGTETVKMKITETDEILVQGYSALSPITDTCCCEEVWNSFYSSPAEKMLSASADNEYIYAVYRNCGGNVECTIGTPVKGACGDLPFTRVPSGCWACFTLNDTDDDYVNKIYSKIFYEWLNAAGVKRNESMPVTEVYPFDMSNDGFEWEIRIPIINER